MRGRDQRGNEGKESGQTLVLFVLGLGVLMGMVALAIDIGLFLQKRRQLQSVADATVLAGAVELPDDVVLSKDMAEDWAENNGIDLAAGDELEITVSPSQTSITAEVTRESSFLFGRVLGLTSADVSASATAQVGSPATPSGIIPFGVLESELAYGSPITLKYDASSVGGPGNFGPLAVDGPGSNIHEQSIMYGSDNSVCALSQPSCADPTATVQTGNLIGSSRDGLQVQV